MLIVRDFPSFVMLVFDIISKAGMIESKVRFDFVFESGVESFTGWSKNSDSRNVEYSGSDHSTW